MHTEITTTAAAMFYRQLTRQLIKKAIVSLLLLLSTTAATAEPVYRLAEFREIDREYLRIARNRLNERISETTGTRFRGDKYHDLPLLQRLLDENYVKPDEPALLQAMGIILGEVLRSEYPLDWIRYIDNEGASRALQLRHQEHFVFPITAISRRASVNAAVDIDAIYQNMREPLAVAYER